MPTLLSPQPRSFSIRTRNFHSAVGNHSTLQSSHCFPQTKKTFSSSFAQSLLSLVFIVGVFGKLFCLDDGLGRRIQTSRGGNIINYYYDPEVEFLELGHNINGSCTWNLYGPDRSGFYGGVQGIGGLESSYNQDNETTKHWFNNYFGDAIGWYDSTNQSFSAYRLTLGAYGPMLGSPIPRVSDPQWRGHYIDETGFYYMGTRYYDPINGRFLSPDPLGHSSSLGLYDYCNGDPVNGLDPDGRCVKKTEAAASYLGNKYVNYSMNEISDPISISRKAIERLGSKLDGVYAILKS